jgi:hypothetical protein
MQSYPKNNYCLSYEGKEKADVLNKYVCSITNLVDENKTLPDCDDRGGNVLDNAVLSFKYFLRNRSRLRISFRIFESNHMLSLHLIVTSRLGIHSFKVENSFFFADHNS